MLFPDKRALTTKAFIPSLLIYLHLQLTPQRAQRIQSQSFQLVFAGIDADGR